jgi:ABC-type transport system involved in multi-copper enzyme maturation permease subunit
MNLNRQIRSEVRKLTTTRSVYSMMAGLMIFMTLGVVATVTDIAPSQLVRPLERQPFLVVPLTIAPLFALLMGIRSYTDEFRHGSIVPTLLASPNRERVLVAKVVTGAAAGAALAAVAVALVIGVGVPLVMASGVELTWSPAAVAEVIGRLLGASALWAALGVGLGLAVRHQVAAIAGVLIWLIAVEGIVSGFLGEGAKYLPGAAGSAIVGVDAMNLLAPGAAALILGGYVVVASMTGAALMRRRDVT